MKRIIQTVGLGLVIALSAAPLSAQEGLRAASGGPAPSGPTRSPFLGSVPATDIAGPPLALSLSEALRRGLERNLGVLLEEQRVRTAEGARWRQLGGLLPDISGRIYEQREKVNLAALGFSGFPGVPQVIGPFNVFDARLSVSQPVIDTSAVFEAKAGAAGLRAERYGYQDARDLVMLVVSNLYLQAVAAESRIDAARSQLDTAESLYQLAVDQNRAGVVPRIEVLRADVERKAASQRRIVADNEGARARSALAQAIGLPFQQQFSIADPMPYSPAAAVDVDLAMSAAYLRRADFLQAQARVAAASAALSAARADRLPRLTFDGNYGWIGTDPSTALSTFSVAANVRVPIFSAATTKARTIESDAELRRRQTELEDLRGRISYEIQTSLRDLNAAAELVAVAQSAVDLAAEALTQARDRFAAGVATNVEVIQAQEATVAAREGRIASLYSHNVAKAGLARAIGVGERDFSGFMGGQATWQIQR
ncbi:MAG: TolC family protein [Vicinamibacterales bacterium]